MKRLFVTTAVIEIGAGGALICCPSTAVALLLGSPLETSVAVTLGRLAGVALFTLGIANWLMHYAEQSAAARRLVIAMVLYNLGAVFLLGLTGIGSQSVGVALWPAVILHAAMAVWCITCLSKNAKHAVQ